MTDPGLLFASDYFPAAVGVPFGSELTKLFFDQPTENFIIHGPNVVRMARALVNNRLDAEPGLLAGTEDEKDRTRRTYFAHYAPIQEALELGLQNGDGLQKVETFMAAAAMYHDVGKTIRRANHPQIGANLLRHFDEEQTSLLVGALQFDDEPHDSTSKHNRFSLICSTTQHHDKFGVVSTGEAALPIFSDILYFTSDERVLDGIVKNVTAVMLLNLADIAAVVPGTAPPRECEEAARLAEQVSACRRSNDAAAEEPLLAELTKILRNPACCLGLRSRKVQEIIADWQILVDAIRDREVMGNRGRLRQRLSYLEQNPARTIQRILRLLTNCTENANARALTPQMSLTLVESVLVGALGSHQFQSFCRQLASAVKLDYALNFFTAIACACVRRGLADAGRMEPEGGWRSLSHDEAALLATLSPEQMQAIVNHITSLFVRILHGIVTRYTGVLDTESPHARRFGFQMRDLTSDDKIRDAIIDLLCYQNSKDHVALTWIADEVTIWSMD